MTSVSSRRLLTSGLTEGHIKYRVMIKNQKNFSIFLVLSFYSICLFFNCNTVKADSVNSPNISLNVDTNRATSTGNGAGNVSVTINTITVAELFLSEYSSGNGKAITFKARPGYQFDPTSTITAKSATIGFNGGGINSTASVVPAGTADEVITFSLTSGTTANQDIIRVNGIKIRILSQLGAAGPAQTTTELNTTSAGGAFSNQGIIAANIVKGAAHSLAFSAQPSTTQAANDLLPAVKIVDFGLNLLSTGDSRTINLALQSNPGAATLLGTSSHSTNAGVATWDASDDLRLNNAADGYTLVATHSGAAFLGSDSIQSEAFNITAGAPGSISIATQPQSSAAGNDILISVEARDGFGNLVGSGVPISIDLSSNPGGAPLLTSSSLTKNTVNGVASWGDADDLHLTAAAQGYKIRATGIGTAVESSSFDVTPGAPTSLRYIQDVSNVTQGVAMSPALSAEVIDLFGNRTNSALPVTITIFENPCSGNLSGNTADSVNGVVTFSNLVFDTACQGNILKTASPGLGWAMSQLFDVAAIATPVPTATPTPNGVVIGIKQLEVKPKVHVKLSAQGSFDLVADPTKLGASLTIKGSSNNTIRYKLRARDWKGLGKPKGSKGFSFHNLQCDSIKITPQVIQANCSLSGKGLVLPEAGPVQAILSIGSAGTTRYCGACGGTSVGNGKKVFKQINCSIPTACP